MRSMTGTVRWLAGVGVAVGLVAWLSGCGDDSTGDGGAGATGTATNATGATNATNATNGPQSSGAAGMTTSGTGTSGPTGGNFACLGQALPTTAPDTITVAGVSQTVGLGGSTPEPSVNVEVLDPDGVQIATTVTGADGAYSTPISTSGVPVDGYIHGTKAGFIDTYVYPPAPLAADIDNGTVLIITSSTFALVQSFESVTQDAGNGFIGVVVSDCDNKPVAGATVTTDPPGVVRYNVAGIPNNTATTTDVDGVAYVFNVPAGDVTVDADAGGQSLREHVINARADVVSTTVVAP